MSGDFCTQRSSRIQSNTAAGMPPLFNTTAIGNPETICCSLVLISPFMTKFHGTSDASGGNFLDSASDSTLKKQYRKFDCPSPALCTALIIFCALSAPFSFTTLEMTLPGVDSLGVSMASFNASARLFILIELACVASSRLASFANALRSNLCFGMIACGDALRFPAVRLALGVCGR